jgi:thioredoxin reductase
MHGFLSRDGIAPAEFRRLAGEQLQAYPDATLVDARVQRVRRMKHGFAVEVSNSGSFFTRALVLATGVVDELPELRGIEEIYGTSAFHCPYCDAWEWRDRRIAVYGKPARALALAKELRIWSEDLAVCFDGDHGTAEARGAQPRVYRQPVVQLESESGNLRAIHFKDGTSIAADVLFFCSVERQRSDLPAQLGCALTDAGLVKTDALMASSVPGVYVAGNAARGLHLAIVAAAEGAAAAFAINESLLEADQQ